MYAWLVILPAQPQDLVSYSFPLSSSSSFFILPAQPQGTVSLLVTLQSQSSTVYCILLYDYLTQSQSAGYCVLLVSVRFLLLLLLLLSTLQSLISPTWLDRFWPDLVTSTGWPCPIYLSHDQIRVKGHVGVTGVKKVIFTKNATSPTDYRVWSCDSCTCISLTPSTKVMGLKIHLGSFEVTGVKRSFSPKMLLLLQITWHGYVTHAHSSARSPLSNLWV